MAIYRVERMTERSYHSYMCGSNEYGPVEHLNIEADSKEEAIKKAEKKGFVVNSYVRTLEEIEEEEKAREERFRQIEEEAKARKEKRLAKEVEKAKAAGMTVEEYRKDKAHKAYIKRLEREIDDLEKELIEKRKELQKATK